MITNKVRSREGGRPRSFEDDDVFRATATVLARLGFSGLTLEAVANDVGVSGPAISKRFGSKQALLRSFLEWSRQRAAARFGAMRSLHASPLAALYARYLIPFDERLEELSAFSGWFDLRNDPGFAILLEEQRRLWETEAASLLAAAQTAGELIECDTGALARAVTAALAGATLYELHDGKLLTQYKEILDTIIEPYRAS